MAVANKTRGVGQNFVTHFLGGWVQMLRHIPELYKATITSLMKHKPKDRHFKAACLHADSLGEWPQMFCF